MPQAHTTTNQRKRSPLQRGQVMNQTQTQSRPRRHHLPLRNLILHIQPHLSSEPWRNKIKLFWRTHCPALVIVTYPLACTHDGLICKEEILLNFPCNNKNLCVSMSFFLCRCATLYPSPRQTTHVPLRFCIFKKKKKGPMETWVKISKVMPRSPHSILQEREGSLMAKKSQSIGQTKHNSGRTHFSIPHLLKLHVKIPNLFFDLKLQ